MNIFILRNIKIKINFFVPIILIYFSIIDFFYESIIILITVLIHEISHIFMCFKFKIKIKEIEIFPFGGVIRLESFLIDKPKEEMLISIIGPLTNIIIFLIFYCLSFIYKSNYIIYFITKINLFMGVFNSLPLLPLDGGKVIRAILSKFYGIKNGTRIVIIITYVISSNIIIYLLVRLKLNNGAIYIILLLVFVMIAATKEKRMAAFMFIKEIMTKKYYLKKKKIIDTHILVCLNSISLKSLVNSFLPNKYHIIIVINENGDRLKTLYEEDIINAIIKFGLDIKIEKLLIL